MQTPQTGFMMVGFIAIPLSQGKVAKISPEDFERVGKYKWTYTRASQKLQKEYAIRREGKAPKRRRVALHRFIMGLTHESPLVVDHINGDGLDNRRENLRVCTQYENMERIGFWERPKTQKKVECYL